MRTHEMDLAEKALSDASARLRAAQREMSIAESEHRIACEWVERIAPLSDAIVQILDVKVTDAQCQHVWVDSPDVSDIHCVRCSAPQRGTKP